MNARLLRLLLAVLRVLFIFVAVFIVSVTPVLANCTMTTILLPDGRILMCTQCCVVGLCQVSCQ